MIIKKTNTCGSVILINALKQNLTIPTIEKSGGVLFSKMVFGKKNHPCEVEIIPYIIRGKELNIKIKRAVSFFPFVKSNKDIAVVKIKSSYLKAVKIGVTNNKASILLLFLSVDEMYFIPTKTNNNAKTICAECSIPAKRIAGKGVINMKDNKMTTKYFDRP
jgi:hypothetical protein